MKTEHASRWRAGLLVLATLMGAQSALAQGYSPQTRILPPLDGANGRNTAVNANGTIAPATGWIDYRFTLPGQRQIRVFGRGNVAAGVTPASGVSRWKILQNNRLDTTLGAGTYNLRVFRNPQGRTESFSFTITARPVNSNRFSPTNLRVPANNNPRITRLGRSLNLGPGPMRATFSRRTGGSNNNCRPGTNEYCPIIFGGRGNAGVLRTQPTSEPQRVVGGSGNTAHWYSFSASCNRAREKPTFQFNYPSSVNVQIRQIRTGRNLRGVAPGADLTPEPRAACEPTGSCSKSPHRVGQISTR